DFDLFHCYLVTPAKSGNLVVRFGLRLRLRGDDDQGRVCSQAQSSHGPSASMSAVSTVAPHQMRRPGGASRYAPMSYAACSASSRLARAFCRALFDSTF